MCLIAFAIGASPRWPLVIAANRDEFLNRPTAPLARWTTDAGKEVISGRDLRAGGTWLGLSPGGRVAMLTNVREPHPVAGERSRGELVMRWLEGGMDAGQFMAQTDSTVYGAFNLVLGDFQSSAWHWLSNQSDPDGGPVKSWQSCALKPGVYGLSNGALDTPWPKTRALKTALRQALDSDRQEDLQAGLWSALQDRKRPSDVHLPRTGVPLALERALSSVFVDFPEHAYGTRSSTVLVVSHGSSSDHNHRHDVLIQEQTHLRPGGPADAPAQAAFRLHWSAAP
ncbi:NRDE family protein [Polaromonas sp.]|uniref:NRDE family protein n=1 Tax=Polaromonas sp. TaxID=1869339 RepID=UPI002736654B|nr:NRDE family protein [Polaromonas sp.]MDP3755524.1 NRDE family protein [Polaromonas sp.]